MMNGARRGWRLLAVLVAMMCGQGMTAMAQIATTTVQDTVYSANGTPATGSVVVSWSAFTTAGGQSVAAGSTSATIGPTGVLTMALAPNAGSTPMGSYYTAVFHLGDGTTSREYCESAAQAILAFATSRTAAVAGSYAMVNPAQDIWPGDILAVTSTGVTSSLLVRSVVVKDGSAVPEVRAYSMGFANDWATEWADGVGLKLSEEIAADAYLPQTASSAPGLVLANLQQLTVTSLTGTALQVDAGTAPPAGGGFEVRRSDWQFGVGVDAADLVLRSPVRSFSIPRAAQVEKYYVRSYDASSPPLYSRFSSGIFMNWPVG